MDKKHVQIQALFALLLMIFGPLWFYFLEWTPHAPGYLKARAILITYVGCVWFIFCVLRARRISFVAVGTLSVLVLSCLWVNFWSVPPPGTFQVAIYDKMLACFDDQTVTCLKVADGFFPLYIRISNERVMQVKDLTPEDASQLPLQRGQGTNVHGVKEIFFICSDTKIYFEEGRLTQMIISDDPLLDKKPIEFATNAEGPFYTLPITEQKLIEIFGSPLRWSRNY